MTNLSKEQISSREKTLLTALLLSAPGPVFTGIAVITSNSTTQLADFIRRGIELAALFISWWVFRQIQRTPALDEAHHARLERGAGISVAAAMVCSGLIMLVITFSRLSDSAAGGSVTAGLVIAVLGLVTNTWFWKRYSVLTREHFNPVIAAQQQLYLAKACVDLCVVAALAAVAIAPAHPLTPYVDISGSIFVAIYLLWNGQRMAQKHLISISDLNYFFRKQS